MRVNQELGKSPSRSKPRQGGLGDPLNRVFDCSCIKDFLRCPYFGCLHNIKGLKPEVTPRPMEFGITFHEALGIWYMEGDLEKALECFDSYDSMGDEKRTSEHGKVWMEEYAATYPVEQWTVWDSELEFSLPMSNGTEFKGRIDLIVEDQGEVCVVDFKTSNGLGASFSAKWRPELQMDGYGYATMRRCGQCDKVIVIGINTAPTGKVRFDRVHSPRSEWELWRWERDYLRITDEIMRSVESGEWYRNTTSCYDYFTPCMYSDICTFDIPEDRWGDYFKVEGEE